MSENFHISDVLSVTTGRLVSSRHMTGIYEILNFLTGDELFTHQRPRAMDECEPWLRTQFPQLMKDSPRMAELLSEMDKRLAAVEKSREDHAVVIAEWVEELRQEFGLPEQIPVYELGAEMHTHIDPIEEAEAMVGKDKVITVRLREK